MDSSQILNIFKKLPSRGNAFKKLSVLQLIEIRDFLEINLKKGTRWSTPLYLEFISRNNLDNECVSMHLLDFHEQYSKRKKELNSLIDFIFKISSNTFESDDYTLFATNKPFELKDDVEIDDYLIAIYNLKKLINGSNRQFVKVLSWYIHTGYTTETLVKKYYEAKKKYLLT